MAKVVRKGTYGKCLDDAETAINLSQQILNTRRAVFTNILRHLAKQTKSNDAYCIYENFVRAEKSGHDWRTNNIYSTKIDLIINESESFKKKINNLLDKFHDNWKEDTKNLKNLLNALLQAIKDTREKSLPGNEILINIKNLNRYLTGYSNKLGTLDNDTKKMIDTTCTHFTEIVYDNCYSNHIKKMDDPMRDTDFKCLGNHDTWWTDAEINQEVANIEKVNRDFENILEDAKRLIEGKETSSSGTTSTSGASSASGPHITTPDELTSSGENLKEAEEKLDEILKILKRKNLSYEKKIYTREELLKPENKQILQSIFNDWNDKNPAKSTKKSNNTTIKR